MSRLKLSRYRRVVDLAFGMAARLFALLVAAVACCIVLFLVVGALPAIRTLGAGALFKARWSPSTEQYGMLAMLACSACACLSAVALALPVALLGAACAKNFIPHGVTLFFRQLGVVLSGLPAVIFGLLGLTVLMPRLVLMMPEKMAKSGGATLFTTIIMLSAMLLPTLFVSCLDELVHVGNRVDEASCALGATVLQTVFCAQLPAMKNRLYKVGMSGIARALCESMAVLLVSGNVVRMPALFSSVRLLAPGMVLEMGYASGIHRAALFGIGLVLLAVALLFESAIRWLDS